MIEDNILKIKPVKTGIEGDLKLEISYDGIQKDQKVVLNPTGTLKEGERVKALPEAAPKEGAES